MVEAKVVRGEKEFAELIGGLARASLIAIDTEFVPEYTFAPDLCLIQVATDSLLAVIDPVELADVSAFWELLVAPGREVVVHAGKEELGFCLDRTGKLPERVFDAQLAAGFIDKGYPQSLSNLLHRALGVVARSKQTRTDWRKRPLSHSQIEYALDDVRHLLRLRERLYDALEARGRRQWYEEEMTLAIEGLSVRGKGERWRKIAGAGSLDAREGAVLREVVRCREERARRLDKPVRWVMRDDLLLDLAKRQPRTLIELERSRGIGNMNGQWAKELLDAIARGVEAPLIDTPSPADRRETPEQQMIVKILSAGMMQLSQEHSISAGLLGSNEDLRELVEWSAMGAKPDDAPILGRGWRGDLCGRWLLDILAGRIVLRVHNDANSPRLVFEPGQNPSAPRP